MTRHAAKQRANRKTGDMGARQRGRRFCISILAIVSACCLSTHIPIFVVLSAKIEQIQKKFLLDWVSMKFMRDA